MLVVSNIAELVRRSNLLGSDRTIANQGGGNTSMKGFAIDHAGREVSVVWVKASGADLASIREPGFPALGLDDLRLLRSATRCPTRRCSSTSAIARSPRTRRAPRSDAAHDPCATFDQLGTSCAARSVRADERARRVVFG